MDPLLNFQNNQKFLSRRNDGSIEVHHGDAGWILIKREDLPAVVGFMQQSLNENQTQAGAPVASGSKS